MAKPWGAFGGGVASADTNTINAGNLYPRNGASTGVQTSAQSAETSARMSTPHSGPAAAAATSQAPPPARGLLGQPIAWWGVILALLIGLMFLAKRMGEEKEFGTIKMSIYNVVIISIAAILGISFWKVLFTRFRVPGLSELVQAI